MALISLTEYERLHIGTLDPARPSVTPEHAAALRRLKGTHGFDVFKFVSEKTLCAQQYVGAMQIGPVTVEVLPKIDGIDDTSVRRNLVAMLAVALDVEISEGDIARVATQRHGILEILIKLFCDKLFAQVHRGLVRRYEAREENLPVMRGKLGIVEQVRLNTANPQRLYCRFDEFQEDNPLNHVLKAAVRLLLRVSRELTNQRELSELMLVFEGVSDVPRPMLPWQRVAFDRLNDRYRGCFKLAELFLKNTPPDVLGGGVQGFSLFFDMNELFEEYVGRVAARVFRPEGFRVTLQGPSQHLVFDESNQRGAFSMRPDVVGMKDQRVMWILDTKWKELSAEEARDGVAQGDIYQMYAYSSRYACPEVLLLYPHHSKLGSSPGIRASYLVDRAWNAAEQAKRIHIATVDLANLKSFPAQLRVLLRTDANEFVAA